MRVIPGNTGWCPAVAGSTFRLVVVVVVGPRAAPGRRRGFCRRVARTMPHAVRRLVLLLSVGWRHGRRGRTRPGFSSGAFSLRNVRLPGVSLRWWLLLLLLLSSSSRRRGRHGFFRTDRCRFLEPPGPVGSSLGDRHGFFGGGGKLPDDGFRQDRIGAQGLVFFAPLRQFRVGHRALPQAGPEDRVEDDRVAVGKEGSRKGFLVVPLEFFRVPRVVGLQVGLPPHGTETRGCCC
mmetsp:Transcript_26786/g.58976  ORF Transcript_26786/g.58976 Transcript_26786/m.58976 type:complete len:234 (+) Transcript_26786:594-1295(+)